MCLPCRSWRKEMSKVCRWLAVSSALSNRRQSLLRAQMQSLFRRSAAGSVMQMLAAATVSDVRWFRCSPAHPSIDLYSTALQNHGSKAMFAGHGPAGSM